MVSIYAPDNCKYKLSKLDKFVFFIGKNDVGLISIDNGEAYVNSASTALTLETVSTTLEENESLDERYEFTHSLTFTVDGYMNINDLNDLYYVIFKDLDGNYWLLNPQFPCKITSTYTINNRNNSTKFIASTKSNFPLLQVKNFTSVASKTCKGYSYCGIDKILLNETKYSKCSNSAVTYTNDGFKQVNFLKNTATFEETFDGTNVSHKLEFKIDFDNYKSSWHYNLLEFTENTYALVLSTKCGKNVSCGFNHGLQPSFVIAGSDNSVNSITITLSDLHDQGHFISLPDNIPYTADTRVAWVWVNNEYACVNNSYAIRLLQELVDAYGNKKGFYRCLAGYEDVYAYLGDKLIGTFENSVEYPCDACNGSECTLECSFPETFVFNDVSCRSYRVKSNSNWSISSDYSGITVSPSSGLADTLYTVQVCNETTPTTTLSSHTLTVSYCNSVRTFNVNVVEASSSGCFPLGLTYYISSEPRKLTIPTTCRVKSVTSNSIYVQQFSIQNGFVSMQVYRNDSGSERTIQVTFTMRDNSTVTVYIIQSSFYSRWIKVGEECDGEMLCDVEHMLSGTSASDISSPTLWMRYNNCVSSDTCVEDTYRWIQTTETACNNKRMYYVEYLQVYSGGTWVNEGTTRFGDETTDTSGICNTNIEHWVVQEGEYLCDGFSKHEKERLYIQQYETQPQSEWIPTDSYRRGTMREADSNYCGYSATTDFVVTTWLSAGTVCDGTSLYVNERLYGSMDEDADPEVIEDWTPTDVYQLGALIEQNSESCGYLQLYEYNWVLTDLTTCDGYNKYYRYKEQTRPSGSSVAWVDVIPTIYSIDGDGTQPKVLAESASTDCGYEEEIVPQYRWVDMNLSAQYYCSGTTKYYKQIRQISSDSGTTWTNMSPAEYRMGASAETNSVDCGGGFEPMYKWVKIKPKSGDVSTYICDNCPKLYATYSDNTTYLITCNSSSTLTESETSAHTSPHSAMTSAEIGNCVITIGTSAFQGCISLSSVTIPNSVTSIGTLAFYNCISLTSIDIPNSVTTIGVQAFYYCPNLTNIDIPNSVITIDNSAFSQCGSLSSVTIGSGVTTIGNYAFHMCGSGLTSITIPDSVTTIGNNAFQYSELTSLTLGSGLTSIGDYTFNCNIKSSVTIPSSVTSIGDYAFYFNLFIPSITCLATTPPSLGSGAFDNTNNCPIYVPAASLSAYQSAWSAYADRIQSIT